MKIASIVTLLLISLCITSARADTVLVTGSNRGLGLVFVQQYAARGWTVIATARAPEGATELQALAAKYPYRPASLPVNRLEDGTLFNW